MNVIWKTEWPISSTTLVHRSKPLPLSSLQINRTEQYNIKPHHIIIVKHENHIPWFYVFLHSTHSFICPTSNFVRKILHFPHIYICATFPVPQLHLQIEHTSACCHCQVLSWKSVKKNWFSLIISHPLYCHCVGLLCLWSVTCATHTVVSRFL